MASNELHDHVRSAVALELTTLPTYLYPYWSIRPSYDGGSGPGQRARQSIMTVIREEMLHMGLSSNVLNALGGTADFTSEPYLPKFPSKILRSKHIAHSGVEVDLFPLGPHALDLLCRIELPDADASKGELTIGEFYEHKVLAMLPHDEDAYRGGRQLAGWDNPGPGELYDVDSYDVARQAIEEILHQGEGLSEFNPHDGDHELAHYYRFREIQQMIEVGSLNPDTDVYPICPHPHAHLEHYSCDQRAANAAFNWEYSRMLDAIEHTLNHDEHPDVYPVAAARMRRLSELATLLRMAGTIPGTELLAGPTFDYIPAD